MMRITLIRPFFDPGESCPMHEELHLHVTSFDLGEKQKAPEGAFFAFRSMQAYARN